MQPGMGGQKETCFERKTGHSLTQYIIDVIGHLTY